MGVKQWWGEKELEDLSTKYVDNYPLMLHFLKPATQDWLGSHNS